MNRTDLINKAKPLLEEAEKAEESDDPYKADRLLIKLLHLLMKELLGGSPTKLILQLRKDKIV